MKKHQGGFAPIVVLVVILVVGAFAGSGVYVKHKIDEKKEVSPPRVSEQESSVIQTKTGNSSKTNTSGQVQKPISTSETTVTKKVATESAKSPSAVDSSPSSKHPVGVASAVPAYPNNTGPAPIPDSLKSQFKIGLAIPDSAKLNMFTTPDSAATTITWYRANIKGWVLWKQAVFSPPNNPDAQTLAMVYRGGDKGLCVLAIEKMFPSVTVVTAQDTWNNIEGCGKITRLVFEDEVPPEDAKDVPTSIGGIYTGPSAESSSHENTPTVSVAVDWADAKVVSDPVDDFWMGGGSPPQVVKFSPSDLLKVSFTNDNQYLYVKFDVAGAIPTLPLSYTAPHGADTVRIVPIDCILDTDNNNSTGNIMNMRGGDVAVEAWFGSPEKANGKMYKYAKYAFYDPNGNENVGTWINGEFSGGGVGYTYVSARYPLAGLKLKSGSIFNVRCVVEAESDSYHHFARDVAPTDSSWHTGITIK
jgi:hypothetical protein